MYPLVFFIIAIVGATIHLVVSKKKKTPERITGLYLSYLIFFNIGLQGLLAASGHILMPNKIAEQIGWPIGSPFQFEIGIANLAIGLAGVMCVWFGAGFKLATVLINSVFLFGAAYGHFVQQAKGDTSPYNTGVFLYFGDIIIPAIILVLMLIYYFKFRVRTQYKK